VQAELNFPYYGYGFLALGMLSIYLPSRCRHQNAFQWLMIIAAPASSTWLLMSSPIPLPLHVSHTRNNALKDKKESRNGLRGGYILSRVAHDGGLFVSVSFLLSAVALSNPRSC
jgi:hypothetical protein